MRIIENLHYSERENETDLMRLYLPECESFPVFVYFHGGGLERGSLDSAAVLGPYLAEQGIATLSINYRMYPDAKFPDFIVDGAKSLKWAKDNMSGYGEIKGIFAGGSSAGGYMSMMLCFDKRYLAAEGLAPTDIAGYIHDAGQPTTHFNVLRERGIDSRRVIVDEAAPLFFVGMEESYQPMTFIVSDNDMEARLEQTDLILKTLSHFRYDESKIIKHLMHGKHCAYVRAKDEEGNSVLGKIIEELITSCLG